MKMSARCWEAKPDLCAYGLIAPDTGEAIHKSTRIITNSKEAARLLNLKCPGCPSHRTISGTVKVGGKTMSLSEYCGGYTQEFASAMLEGFLHDLQPINYLTLVANKRKLLDAMEEQAAERLFLRNPSKRSKIDHTEDEDEDKKKKKRRKFAEELRAAANQKGRSMTTRSMTRSSQPSSSSSGTRQTEEETPFQDFGEDDLTERYMEDLFEESPTSTPRMTTTTTTTT